MNVTKFLRFLFQVPFARSQIHLLELTEKICENFEEYAQAKWKSNGQPTIIRITNPDGNMNPDFGKVDVVPDEDLNTKLKFHVSLLFHTNKKSPKVMIIHFQIFEFRNQKWPKLQLQLNVDFCSKSFRIR